MARRLYALLPKPGEPIEFAAVDDKGVKLMSLTVGNIDSQDEVTLFVPATEVGCFEVRLPAQNPAELRRSAAFALEDELAAPVEDVHVAIGTARAGGLRPVHVVDPSLMEKWVATAEDLGLKSARLVADASVLPETPLAVDAGSRILFSLGARRFAADAGLPDDALKALANSTGTAPSATSDSLARKLGAPTAPASSLPLLAQLAQWAETGPALTDLRQGRFATRRQTEMRLGAWRPTLVLAALGAAFFLAVTALEGHSLQRLASALDRQARSTYAAAFPGTPVPANLSAAVRTQDTAPITARLAFLEAAALLYDSIPAESGVSIQGLRYDRQTGRLVANMVYPAYGTDIDLKRSLESRGLGVSLGDSRQQEGRVLGDLTLEVTQ